MENERGKMKAKDILTYFGYEGAEAPRPLPACCNDYSTQQMPYLISSAQTKAPILPTRCDGWLALSDGTLRSSR